MKRFALASALIAAVAAACSLGLDESKIATSESDSGIVEPEDSGELPTDTGTSPPGKDVLTPPVDASTVCQGDQDCKAGGCLGATGKCDTASHACVYDVCKQTMACKRAQCDMGSNTCRPPGDVNFRSGTFRVKDSSNNFSGIACDPASNCFAAVYPFLFIGLPTGVVAYSAADPNPDALSVPPIPVVGAPFIPNWIVASGRRVYLIEKPLVISTPPPPSKIRIAWIDVPSDPFAKQITARTSFLAMSDVNKVDWVFRGPGDELFLVTNENSIHFPTAKVQPPLLEPSSLPSVQNTNISGVPVATSGGRLVTYLSGPRFGLESGTGGTSPTYAGTSQQLDILAVTSRQGIVGVGGATLPGVIAQGPRGGLVWSVSQYDSYDGVDGDGNPYTVTGTHYATLAWILQDDLAAPAAFSAAIQGNVTTYSQDPGVRDVAGPLAFFDADNVLLAVRKPGDEGSTRIQVATHTGQNVTSDQAKILDLPAGVPVNKVGLATAHGFGYVLTADSPTSANVYIVAPSCAP